DDQVKAITDEIHAVDHELRTLPKEELARPAHGRDARRYRGHRHAQRYTHRDLLHDRRAELEQQALRARQLMRTTAGRTLRALERVLEGLGYLDYGRPTEKAAALRELFDANGLILSEALARGVFRDADAAEVIEALSWFCYDRDKAFYNRFRLPPGAWDIRDRIGRIHDQVLRAEAEAGLTLTPGFTGTFVGIAYAWCHGLEFAELLSGVGLPEGDIMLTFNKTLDLARQVRDATRVVEPESPLLTTLAEGERLMRRGIVALC